MNNLTENETKVLDLFGRGMSDLQCADGNYSYELSDDIWWISKWIVEKTGLKKNAVRVALRGLREKRMIFHSVLWNPEEGGLNGSGHAISEEGLEFYLKNVSPDKPTE